LKVSSNVKTAMQCLENFGVANAPNAPNPGCAPVLYTSQNIGTDGITALVNLFFTKQNQCIYISYKSADSKMT